MEVELELDEIAAAVATETACDAAARAAPISGLSIQLRLRKSVMSNVVVACDSGNCSDWPAYHDG